MIPLLLIHSNSEMVWASSFPQLLQPEPNETQSRLEMFIWRYYFITCFQRQMHDVIVKIIWEDCEGLLFHFCSSTS